MKNYKYSFYYGGEELRRNKKELLLIIISIVISIFSIGCSKSDKYTLNNEKSLEVGVDIPEGVYFVVSEEKPDKDSEKVEGAIGVIDSDEGPGAVYITGNNFSGEEVELIEGMSVFADGNVELIKK